MAPESLNVENAVFSTKSGLKVRFDSNILFLLKFPSHSIIMLDSWSFGVLSWEVLTRREPHAKIDIYEAARRIRKVNWFFFFEKN